MADPPPNQSRPGLGGAGERPTSSGDLHRGPSSRASVPPSEPRSSRASFDALDAQVDRPARLQMIVALILGLVLVAIPLYLWRRPRAESISVNNGTSDAGAFTAAAAAAAAAEEKVALSEPKILSCHDPGPKKTPPDRCDHIPDLEKAFAKAIEENTACVSKDTGGGTIIYVADVHMRKKTASISTPKSGRTLRSSKIAGECERAIRRSLGRLPFESFKHEHARYRVSITATYPSSTKP